MPVTVLHLQELLLRHPVDWLAAMPAMMHTSREQATARNAMLLIQLLLMRLVPGVL